jgi:hypothetical protein
MTSILNILNQRSDRENNEMDRHTTRNKGAVVSETEYRIQMLGGKYWDGKDFVTEQKNAKVFCNYSDIVNEVIKIITPKLFRIVATFQRSCPECVEIDNCDLSDEKEQNEKAD